MEQNDSSVSAMLEMIWQTHWYWDWLRIDWIVKCTDPLDKAVEDSPTPIIGRICHLDVSYLQMAKCMNFGD